jgi:tRNA-intron endonuclease
MSTPIEAIFEGDRVFICKADDAAQLLQGGYGYACEDNEGSILSPWEALYLVTEERLTIYHRENKEPLEFSSIVSRFLHIDDKVWDKYLIYRDLRSRGYVVRDGIGLGVDFRLYSRGTYKKKPARYLVYALCEGTPTSIHQIQQILTIAQNIKKQVIVAVMDRRGEIVYYSLGKFNF